MQSWRERLPPADSHRAVTFQPRPALLQVLHLFKDNAAARASEGLLRLFFYLLRMRIGRLDRTLEIDGVAGLSRRHGRGASATLGKQEIADPAALSDVRVRLTDCVHGL